MKRLPRERMTYSFTVVCGGSALCFEDLVPDQELAADAIALGEHDSSTPANVVRITANRNGQQAWQRTLTSGGTSTGFKSDNVVCIASRLYVAVGPHVAALDIVSGSVLWNSECDPATCWTLHQAPGGTALIVHGELDISKLSLDGEMLWQ